MAASQSIRYSPTLILVGSTSLPFAWALWISLIAASASLLVAKPDFVRRLRLRDPGGATSERIPTQLRLHTGCLSGKALALFGLGAIGSPSGVGFAKAGMGELCLVDDDIVEPGTVVRWELGLDAAGLYKAPALAGYVARNWPYTEAKPFVWRVGSPLHEQIDELDAMNQALQDVDLIYDATAELGIQYLLASIAGEHQLPYVAVSATAGGWGGLIPRIHPQLTERCWICHRLHLQDGSIPRPSADPNDHIQPTGCAETTFVGSAFDLEEVASQGVRSTVESLVEPDPAQWWDVAVGTFRSESAGKVTPSWRTYKLIRHPRCPAHPDPPKSVTENRRAEN